MDSVKKIEVTVNENEHSFNAETNVQQLLEELKTPSNGIAIAINEHVIPKTKWKKTKLNNKDKILIITATQGG